MESPNFTGSYTNTPNQEQEKAIARVLDALCDVALSLPVESKTRAVAVSAEADLRAAFSTPAKAEDGNLDDEHRKRFGKAFTRAGQAEDLVKKLASQTELDGMTLRQYAAIKLKVPNSGTDWLDAMIRESLRDDFAKKMISVLASERDDAEDDLPGQPIWESFQVAGMSYDQADAMLKAREAS